MQIASLSGSVSTIAASFSQFVSSMAAPLLKNARQNTAKLSGFNALTEHQGLR